MALLPFLLFLLFSGVYSLDDCGAAACQCPFVSLDSSNLKSITGTSPSYSNMSSLPMSTPFIDATCGNCSVSASCRRGYSLVVYYFHNYDKFEDGIILTGICDYSNNQWTLEDLEDDYESGNFYEQFVFG